MPPVPLQETSLFELEIDALGQSHLNNVSKWGKFIAITGLVIVALAALLLAAQYREIAERIGRLVAFDSSTAGLLIAVLVIFGGIALLLLVFLLKACVLIKQGLLLQDSDRIADGFKALKVVFTISIIYSSLTILGVIISLVNF